MYAAQCESTYIVFVLVHSFSAKIKSVSKTYELKQQIEEDNVEVETKKRRWRIDKTSDKEHFNNNNSQLISINGEWMRMSEDLAVKARGELQTYARQERRND